MIKEIKLLKTLPAVFVGSEDEPPVATSQVWLHDVVFSRGERRLIEAESGTGKSSLCSYIYGARTDYRGVIEIDGEDVASFSIDRWTALRRRAIAYLPQEMRLFPELSAIDNINIKNGLTDTFDRSTIVGMLDALGIADKADVSAARLSVGQQQRVAIIRALCQPFDFLLLDEPVSHLDERNNAVVAELIEKRLAETGAGVIATSVGNKIKLNDMKLLKL